MDVMWPEIGKPHQPRKDKKTKEMEMIIGSVSDVRWNQMSNLPASFQISSYLPQLPSPNITFSICLRAQDLQLDCWSNPRWISTGRGTGTVWRARRVHTTPSSKLLQSWVCLPEWFFCIYTLVWWLSECRNKAGTQFHFFGPAMLFRRLECQMLLGCSSCNRRTLRIKEDWQKTKALTIFGSSGIILCLHSCSSVTKPSKSFVPCKPLFEYKWSFNLATYRTRKINLVQVQMIWNIILHINYKYII